MYLPPDDDDDGASPSVGAPATAPARSRPLRSVLPLPAYLDLPATRYKCGSAPSPQRTSPYSSSLVDGSRASWHPVPLPSPAPPCVPPTPSSTAPLRFRRPRSS
ncbi:hypothetical protein AB1Y20_011536 [Prymnesium parvum]|uniref:Uncharacterized protein n=1 Tax=Prymnesium parvum TaxID=97485 RepID=A0AB34IHQ0_PRYPA